MRKITRRQFLKRSTTALSAVAAVPYIVRSSALGRGGSVAASERITMGGIGFGGQGTRDMRNFMTCADVQFIASAEVAHRSTTTCHVANICLRLGRNMRWNPQTERFVNDPEADKMISRPMRRPWHL